MEDVSLARRIMDTCYLTGDFVLRSGQRSNVYFDKYLFESDPTLLRPIAQALIPLIPPDTDVLAGLELGGIPLATALSLETGLPAVFVRKAAKNYGTCKAVEGISVASKHVCVVEDVITTGGQVVESTAMLRSEGALVSWVLCAIWRGKPENTILQDAGICRRSAFNMEELLEADTFQSR